MKVKFGALATGGSGSLQGHTLQNSHGGLQLRTKPIPHGMRSNSQSLIRSFNVIMQAGWRSLTEQQRNIWTSYAVNKTIFNRSGDHHLLSGHDLWMKYQYGRLAEGLPFLTDPSGYKTQYLGPELIINGDFSSSIGWVVDTGWTISAGKANFLDTVVGSIKRIFPMFSDSTYHLIFDIMLCPALGNMLFINQSNTSAFLTPYGSYTSRVNGKYTIDAVCSGNHTRFGFRGNIIQSAFSLDNVSMKIWL